MRDDYEDQFSCEYESRDYYEPEKNEPSGNRILTDNSGDGQYNYIPLSYKTPDATYMDSWNPIKQSFTPGKESFCPGSHTGAPINMIPFILMTFIIAIIIFAYTSHTYVNNLKKIIKLLMEKQNKAI